MQPSQIAIVRHQFGVVATQGGAFPAAFYAALLRTDPGLRVHLADDPRRTGAALMAAMAHILLAIDNLPAVAADIRPARLRKTGLAVGAGRDTVVADALLAGLEACLGEAFDERARAAWAAAHGLIAEALLQAEGCLDARETAP